MEEGGGKKLRKIEMKEGEVGRKITIGNKMDKRLEEEK